MSGCAKENYNSGDAACCVPLTPYTADFQQQLAHEIEHASADAAFPVALQDYAALRAQLRAGCGVMAE